VLIELFLLRATAEALQANIDCKSATLLQQRPVDPKFQVEGVAATNYSSSQKTRLSGLSYGIQIFCFVTIHAFDRRMDTFLVASPRWHSIQHSKKQIVIPIMLDGR